MTRMNTTPSTNGTVRAAVYVRISQDKTGQRAGVERQEQDCRALADRLGWAVTRVYADNDISAYSGKPRPDYKLMLADIAAGQIDAVLTWHPDRLHRSPKELEHYIDVCEAGRVPTHTVQAGNWDLSTPAGRMVARQIGAVSRYESEHKSERVKAAWIQSAKRGVWHGGLRPYGYGPDGVTVVPDEAAEVAKMVEAIASGQSLRSVVRDLNARGVPTAKGNGSRWQSKTVREMLMRPRLAGYSVHNGEIAGKGMWEPIVEETAWRTVVSILSNPARYAADGERLGRGVSWLGSGIYLCGVCGGTLKVGTSSRGRKTYRCKNRADDDRVHVTREAFGLDAYVEGVVIDYWSKPGRVEKVLARDDSVDTKALRKELADINAEKDKLAIAHGKGQIDLGQLITATKVFDDRAKTITKQLASVGWRSPVEPFAHGTVSDVWETLTLPQRRAILKVTATITVEPMGRRPRNDESMDAGVSVRWLATRASARRKRPA
jgi:DNA invertase Pin-like site-specific DNA recombinase